MIVSGSVDQPDLTHMVFHTLEQCSIIVSQSLQDCIHNIRSSVNICGIVVWQCSHHHIHVTARRTPTSAQTNESSDYIAQTKIFLMQHATALQTSAPRIVLIPDSAELAFSCLFDIHY